MYVISPDTHTIHLHIRKLYRESKSRSWGESLHEHQQFFESPNSLPWCLVFSMTFPELGTLITEVFSIVARILTIHRGLKLVISTRYFTMLSKTPDSQVTTPSRIFSAWGTVELTFTRNSTTENSMYLISFMST